MKSEILVQSVSIEIEIITKRIFFFFFSFYQTNNIKLRKRLSKEYFYLFNKFIDLRSKVSLFNIWLNCCLKDDPPIFLSTLLEFSIIFFL